MSIEKEYYQYLNQVKKDCETACPDNPEWAYRFFEKAASPHHYWRETQPQQPGQPPKQTEKLTDKQKTTIDNFLDKHEELWDELQNKKVEELSKDEASRLIGDWMRRFIKK